MTTHFTLDTTTEEVTSSDTAPEEWDWEVWVEGIAARHADEREDDTQFHDECAEFLRFSIAEEYGEEVADRAVDKGFWTKVRGVETDRLVNLDVALWGMGDNATADDIGAFYNHPELRRLIEDTVSGAVEQADAEWMADNADRLQELKEELEAEAEA